MASLGNWDPEQEKQEPIAEIDQAALLKFISLSESDTLEQLSDRLSQTEIDNYRPLMKSHKDAWSKVAGHFSNDQLVHLIRFFTRAEEKLAGWEAGSLSPVIWLCRELKSRGAFPDKALIDWIKANSRNKFLPYGNILDL